MLPQIEVAAGVMNPRQSHRINAENPDVALIIGVKMSHVMWGDNLGKHTNHNTKEPAEFRH
jgi:hypothetical protein